MDEIDVANEEAERLEAIRRKEHSRIVARIPDGAPGDCEGPCADWSPRLIKTARGLLCPRCRDRLRLP
jgi:hypothetical protein